MKKYICLIFAFMLVMSMVNYSNAASDETLRLSELSPEECIDFLKSYGVSIPDKFEDEVMWAPFIHDIMVKVENNPQITFHYNYSVQHYFANDIKDAVKEYYGINESAAQSRVMISAPLQDNEVYGSWLAEYEGYNCYAYAIGESDWIDPGVLDWTAKGNDQDMYDFNDTANIYTIANLVEDDLISKGYTVTAVSSSMPNTTVTEHSNLICVRKDTDGVYYQYGTYFLRIYDYHFMKLCENGSWYHKPGGTNPLRYLYVPTNNRIWVGEYGIEEDTYRDMELTYDSDIWFIEYTTPHKYEYEYCGSNQHILTCNICGETSGTAKNCVYLNNICKHCGRYNGSTQITPKRRSGIEASIVE